MGKDFICYRRGCGTDGGGIADFVRGKPHDVFGLDSRHLHQTTADRQYYRKLQEPTSTFSRQTNLRLFLKYHIVPVDNGAKFRAELRPVEQIDPERKVRLNKGLF